MDEGRKGAYKKVTWILSALIFLVFSMQTASAGAGYLSNVQANTLYYISNGIPVSRSDGLDVIFKDANGNTVTPAYYWVRSVSNGRAYVYVYFSNSYSTLYVFSEYSTAYQTNGYPAEGSTATTYFAPHGGELSCTLYPAQNGRCYLGGSDVNSGYETYSHIVRSTYRITVNRIVEYTITGLGSANVWNSTPIKITWTTSAKIYVLDPGHAGCTNGICYSWTDSQVARTNNLIVSKSASGVENLYFSAYKTNITYVADTTSPTINSFSASFGSSGVVISFNVSDDLSLRAVYIYEGSTLKWSNTGLDGLKTYAQTVTLPFPSSLPMTYQIVVHDSAYNQASASQTFSDTENPALSAVISTGITNIIITFNASDDILLKNYVVLLNGEQLTAENIYAQSTTKTLTYSPAILIGKTDPEFTIIVYDLASNSNSTTLKVTKTGITVAILDENRNAALNFTNFQELYFYLISENQKIWVVQNGQYLGNLQNDTTIDFLTNLTETIRVTWLYKNYPDYYAIEITPAVAGVLGSPITIGIPGLINNTTIPYLYEFLVLSNDKKPVIIERVNPKLVKLASVTQYPYDRYLTASTFLQRELYNLYTVEGGVLVFLSAVDGGRAQAVNIDALLAQKKPVAMIYGVTLDCEWLDNKTMRVVFKTVDPAYKLTTINVYVNNTLITTISQIANEMQGIIAFDQFNVTITNQTRIKIEAIRENVKIVREFLGYEEVKFRLPVPFAIGLGICLLLFGLTLLGIESVIRYFGFVMLFMVIAVVALSDLNDTILRIVLVVALILIVVFIAANLRGERE